MAADHADDDPPDGGAVTVARICCAYFGGEPSFSTASELRDALLAAYPGVEFFGAPIAGVPQGRDFDTAPAWGFLNSLLCTRTDWAAAAGVALQHAAQYGGELARIALADLLENFQETALLLEWTEPVAQRWPGVRTSGARGCAWRNERLDTIVARQRALVTERPTGTITTRTPDGEAAITEVTTAADLQQLLATSTTGGHQHPWSWLRAELLFHPWMRPVMPEICAHFAAGAIVEVRAMLDWFVEEHDLWRYLSLLEGWSDTPPAWWDEPAKSRGRRNPLRWQLVPAARTLGDVALRALYCARRQVATPPIVDLPPISSWHEEEAPRERPRTRPTIAAPPPRTLARASLGGADAFVAPRPALSFTEHHAEVSQLLVIDHGCVLSVDRDRVALLWNPRTAALISRHELPAAAVERSVFTTQGGELAYVAHQPGALTIHALEDHRELARAAPRGLSEVGLALCAPDLSRVLIASDGALVLVSLVDGTALARESVSRHEPSILSLYAEGAAFRVRFHHIAMDMYPTDEEALFDGETLAELSRERGAIEPLAPLSSGPSARVEIVGTLARIRVVGDRPLSDLAAHTRPICRTEWTLDGALLTADTGGEIDRWDLDLTTPLTPTQHDQAVTAVRFTSAGVVSFTARDTKLWRDEALLATLPAFTTPILDEADGHLIDVGGTVRTYSLKDGASLAAHATAPGAAIVGARGRICVGLTDIFPNLAVSLPDGNERALPMNLAGILSRSAPPIVHAGRLLLTQYTMPTRSLALDTFTVCAERRLHEDGTCWTALHPDGRTLYSAGYADGHVAASDFLTLGERRRWSVFEGGAVDIRAAVLLAKHERIVVAGAGRLRRIGLGKGMLARIIRETAECAVDDDVEELVADAAERRVVVFFAKQGVAPRVIDVASMRRVDARAGEVEAASARRSVSPESAARGFESAFVCGDGRWLVGWARRLGVTPVSLGDRPLRAAFSTRQVAKYEQLRGALVDDTLGQLWLLGRDGALLRTSLVQEAALDTVATIVGGKMLTWVTPSVFAAHDEAGSIHYLRTTGERICTLEAFIASPNGPCVLTEAAAVTALPDGTLRAATIASSSCVTLRDDRTGQAATAVAIAAPFVASRHGDQVLRWDLRTGACSGAWTASTQLTAIDVAHDGAVLAGEASGGVTLLR